MSRPLRLIYIEDNDDDLELVLHQLRQGGFAPSVQRVECVEDLRTALLRKDWDIVLSDYHLPTFNASAALALVQASGQDLPFIVVTGTIGEERAVELMRAGAEDFVLKEQLGRLTAAVERAIGDAQVRADRARAVGLLHSTNLELATLVEAAPLAIVVIDPAGGTVRSWNPAATRLLGWTVDETVGRATPQLEDGDSQAFATMLEQTRDGRTFTSVDTRLKRKDGKLVEVSLSMAPLGSTSGCLLIAEDTTERRSLEAMLLQSQKMEAVGMLAGGVAHDFNNLLGIILGFGERLLTLTPEGDRRRRPAEEICRAADRASALTRQLLAFSRKQVLRTQVVEINAVVRQMEAMLRRLIGEDIALHAELTDAPTPVVCDPNQIEMVLMNLAVNARDAMPLGGRLKIATRLIGLEPGDPLVHSGLVPGRYLLLTVSDTGIGMDAATCARAFEPFFTTKERGHGTGLGLATAFGVVKQSGGCISVDSVLGKGTSFLIYLPLAGSLAPVDKADTLVAEQRGSETILVVEDEDGLRELIGEYLEAQGYQVLSAGTAEAALDLQRKYSGRIHLLLTDIILPGMGGVMLSQELVAARPGICVLYMSGYTDDAIMRQGTPVLGAAMLAKPFRPNLLFSRIREALSSARPPAAH